METTRPLRTPGRSQAKRREAILAALGRVISRDGVAAASVGTVAQEAGVARGALHYYFGSTQELVRALVEHRRMEESKRLAELPAGGDVRERLKKLVAALTFAGAAERLHEARLSVALAGFAMGDKVAARTLAEQRQRRLDVVAELVADGVRAKSLAPADAAGAASHVVAAVDGAIAGLALAEMGQVEKSVEAATRAVLVAAGAKDPARG